MRAAASSQLLLAAIQLLIFPLSLPALIICSDSRILERSGCCFKGFTCQTIKNFIGDQFGLDPDLLAVAFFSEAMAVLRPMTELTIFHHLHLLSMRMIYRYDLPIMSNYFIQVYTIVLTFCKAKTSSFWNFLARAPLSFMVKFC